MKKSAVFTLSLLGATISGAAVADFHIEYPASVSSTERGLLSNRTHYDQKGEANFRMTDADRKPEQSKYTEAGHKMVVDLGYRVVTHHGAANNEYRVRTFGNGLPLINALGLVMPKGWQAYQHTDLDAKRLTELVSFQGNLLWTDALFSIGDRYGYQFHVDWYERTVLISQGRVTSEQEAEKVKVIAEPLLPEQVRKRGFKAWWERNFKRNPAPVVVKPVTAPAPAPVTAPAPAPVVKPAVVEAPIETAAQPTVEAVEPCVCVPKSQVKRTVTQTSWQTRTAKKVGDDRGIIDLKSSKSDSGSFTIKRGYKAAE